MATLREHVPSVGALNNSINVNVRVLGARESAANIRALSPAARRAMLKAFVDEAYKIIRTSQQRYVPIDTATLRNSAMVIPHAGQYPSVEFGYGGAAKHYAVVQHENTWFRHYAGGQAKYLSVPVERAQQRVVKSAGQELRNEFRKFDTRRFE